jgi:hypothetical protein
MNNNQRKKHNAKIHNLRKDEKLAYEIHYAIYPEQRPVMRISGTSRRNKLTPYFAMVAGLSAGWNS